MCDAAVKTNTTLNVPRCGFLAKHCNFALQTLAVVVINCKQYSLRHV